MRRILPVFVFLLSVITVDSVAQSGLLNDDFSTGNTFQWAPATGGAIGQLVNGQYVVTMALQSGGKYRGDLRKTGGVTVHAGQYPIVAIQLNKPARCNFFLDTNLGAYRNTNNNHTVLYAPEGNVYYWDLSQGPLGTTTLLTDAATTLSTFQFKVADVVLAAGEIAASDIRYEVRWVRTFASEQELRAAVGVADPVEYDYAGTFAHPGLLHSAADLQRIKGFVTNQFGRPYASYQLLRTSPLASATYSLRGPYQYLTRDNSQTVNGVPGATVKTGVENDFLAAYYNALLWTMTGNTAHAQKAVEIINAYAATTQGIIGVDAELNGLYGFILANAAEIMRYRYDQWSPADVQACEAMLQNVFYPVIGNFRPCAHGNWDIICMKALMAIAVFTNDVAMFNKTVTYFYSGEGNGSIDNYVLTAAGQLQESNRDQAHSMLALGSLAELAEIALKQGVDLYAASDNAILRGFEYTSRYNLGYTVPFETSFDFCERNYQDYTPEAISPTARGVFRPVFEIAYNHYVYRKGLEMPNTLNVLKNTGPEGPSVGADHPGYGSLLFYLNSEEDHPFDTTGTPPDPFLGLIDDNFTAAADGWAAATSGSVASVVDGQLKITLVTQTNGKKRGDVKRSAGALLYLPNYPILAIKFKKPAVGNITFDTNLGAFGNGANKWTGKVGDDIYYYDLTKSFGASGVLLPKDASTTLTTFQFKVADVTSAETDYTVDWVKTFHSVPEIQSSIVTTANLRIAGALAFTDESNTAEYELYPNPATEQIDIRYTDRSSEPLRIELVSGAGTTLFATSGRGGLTIATRDYPRGVYVLKVTTATSVRVHRIVLK